MTDSLDPATALTWITTFIDTFDARQGFLTELDRLAGDGDFGTNIASALERTQANLPTTVDATPALVFTAVADGFLATGGTSGPLFGMWFREIAKAGQGSEASLAELASGVASGLSLIQRIGGAHVGDNTMIDALEPASVALSAAADRADPVTAALTAAAEAARIGAESTGDLIAAKGRASYVGELARGVLDPGAVTIALFFEAGAAAVGSSRDWVPLGASAA